MHIIQIIKFEKQRNVTYSAETIVHRNLSGNDPCVAFIRHKYYKKFQ